MVWANYIFFIKLKFYNLFFLRFLMSFAVNIRSCTCGKPDNLDFFQCLKNNKIRTTRQTKKTLSQYYRTLIVIQIFNELQFHWKAFNWKIYWFWRDSFLFFLERLVNALIYRIFTEHCWHYIKILFTIYILSFTFDKNCSYRLTLFLFERWI